MRIGPVHISGGFLILSALVYLFDNTGSAGLLFLAVAVHELGHYLSIRALGGQVHGLFLGLIGLRMDYTGETIGYPGEVWIALSGPVLNLMLAYGASLYARHSGSGAAYYLAGISLILCMFNLLPAYQLDGGRALYCLLALLGNGVLAHRISCIVSCVVIFVLLLAGGALLIWSGWNFTLLAVAVWLLAGYCKSGRNAIK